MKKRAFVICPGRGSYTKETMGYLKQYAGAYSNFIQNIDQKRKSLGELTLTEMDLADSFRGPVHTKGENASVLIYACAYTDFLSINREQFEVVAVAGNSMGWYIALAAAEALDSDAAFQVINTMGSMMKDEVIGGQVIYPLVDENWVRHQGREKEIQQIVAKIQTRPDHEIYPSIRLGGYMVWGGNKQGLAALLKELPPIENYPFQLINHAAFHTPLLKSTSQKAFEIIPRSLFRKPQVPVIDGRGVIWSPYATDTHKLYEYTLGHQVTETYDFSKSVIVGLKEYAPDCIILLGPGSTLGGSLGQILIESDWNKIKNKNDFMERQKKDPVLLAMGRPEQRESVV